MVNFFGFFRLFLFCFVVAICYLVHDVEAIHGICKLQTASGNLFRNMSYARETTIEI